MTAGSFYYVTVLHVVSNASKNVSFSVTKPNGTLLSPIPREYFVAYRKGKSVCQSFMTPFRQQDRWAHERTGGQSFRLIGMQSDC